MSEQVKLTTRTSSGSLIRVPATIEYADNRIYFLKSPFSLRHEIKAMAGSRWHQFEDEGKYAGQKIWSVADTQRNRFQLRWLCGENVYAWFDRPLQRHTYRPLQRGGEPKSFMPHQADLADAGLTYHYQIFAAEMGTGKTLAAQMVIEMSGVPLWYWIGPKTSLPNIRREFDLWGFPSDKIKVLYMTYEALTKVMREWDGSEMLPQGFIVDESSRCKTPTAQRTWACQTLADKIRDQYGLEHGYVIEMSGTPSPKTPMDWWAQCEIAWPGFLMEGSWKAMENRLAFLQLTDLAGQRFNTRTGYRDDEKRCNVCGKYRDEGAHDQDDLDAIEDYHPYEKSKNEISYLSERLKGLVVIKHKKDCLTLPDKRYRRVVCTPTPSTLRVARSIVNNPANNAVTAMTLLRELSDGFQYQEVRDGTLRCTHCKDGQVTEWQDPDDSTRRFATRELLQPDYAATLIAVTRTCQACGGTCEVPKIVRVANEVPCPKEKALRVLLEENEETGRLVVFAGFTGSVDRIVRLCLAEKWDVVRCDQGEFQVSAATSDSPVGRVLRGADPLGYWADRDNSKVAFVANPESGGMSLTLVEARMAVYWSNTWKPEYRVQSEDRIHRKGMDENLGCTIVDLIHLPSDDRVLQVLRENRRIELLTLGEALGGIDWEAAPAADKCAEEVAS